MWCCMCMKNCTHYWLRTQLRTTYCLSTQTIILKENKNNHYHNIFNSQHIVQHSILNLSHPYLMFQVSLVVLSQSDIQILYGLQIDNDIQQSINNSWTGILWSVVSILDLLHCFSFQFIKNGSATMSIDCVLYKLQKWMVAIHNTEIERLFLAAKGFNTNLVQFLLPYHFIISNVDICSFMCAIFHMHGRVPEMVLHAQNLVHESL